VRSFPSLDTKRIRVIIHVPFSTSMWKNREKNSSPPKSRTILDGEFFFVGVKRAVFGPLIYLLYMVPAKLIFPSKTHSVP
jgi:hypothetical protein